MEIRDISKLIYKMKLVEQKISRHFENEVGFSLTRYEILVTLVDKGEISQTELQEFIKIDQAAITRHIKILEEKNYIVRRRNPNNNREIYVSLTEKSKEEISGCSRNCSSLDIFFETGFTKEDAENLLLLLEKVDNNLK